VWQPSSSRTAQEVTRISSLNAATARPEGGDALCFQLALGAPLKVGRAPGCDVLINDATVSREHLWLEPIAGSENWTVRAQPGANASLLNGQPLPPGEARPLRPGNTLRLGDVTLTYLDTPGLAERLDAQIRAVTAR
jgi:pSer/pThr/pTyr-binding forkhead associated (FHA) protein